MPDGNVSLDTLIDLGRYPILDLGSAAARTVVARARESLARQGAAELEGFVSAVGLEALVADAKRLAPLAHRSGGQGTAYLGQPDESAPPDHPSRWSGPYRVGAVPYDVIPYESTLRQLYEWDPVRGLIEAILDRGPLYRYADPFGALNLAVMEEGDELQWHFDQTDFVVSLAVQPSRAGGLFEMAPLIREPGDEKFTEVAAVLAGRSDRVEILALNPGTLLVFEGRHSLHRVTPVIGPVARLVGLLAYDTKAGTMGSDALRADRYGRTVAYPQPPSPVAGW